MVPLRTILENGDQVEILASEAQHPQPSVAALRRHRQGARRRSGASSATRSATRPIELGRKIYDEIVARLPAPLGADALKRAVKKLKVEDEDALMIEIARKRDQRRRADGSADARLGRRRRRPAPLGQRTAISIKGLTPGVAYHLADCCHPIPGDRIVGLRREDEEIEVHVIGCDKLASGIDADWLDLAWGDGSDGGTARLA